MAKKNLRHKVEPENIQSESQADGTGAQDAPGTVDDQKFQASGVGPTGHNPGTTGGKQELGRHNPVPEAKDGIVNPSSPTRSTEEPNAGRNMQTAPKNPHYESSGADIGNPDPNGTMSVNPDDMAAQRQPTLEKRKRESRSHDETGNKDAA